LDIGHQDEMLFYSLYISVTWQSCGRLTTGLRVIALCVLLLCWPPLTIGAGDLNVRCLPPRSWHCTLDSPAVLVIAEKQLGGLARVKLHLCDQSSIRILPLIRSAQHHFSHGQITVFHDWKDQESKSYLNVALL